MNIPVVDMRRSEPVSPQEPSQLKQAVAWVLICIVLLALAAGAYWILKNRKAQSPFPKEAEVQLSLGPVPASTLFTLTQKHDAYTQVSVAGQPEGTIVIDRLLAGGVQHYLVLDPSTGATTLYREENGTLMPLTTSASVKFDVSYDEAHGTFVYLAKTLAQPADFLTTTEWDVTVLGTDGVERVITTGVRAQAAMDGAVVANFDGQLLWASFSGDEVVMLERDMPWLFTVNAAGTELASYNSVSGQVDRFDITGGPRGIQLLRSDTVPGVPSVLAYMGESIVIARPDASQSMTMFSVAGRDGEWTVAHPNPGVASVAFNLSIDL